MRPGLNPHMCGFTERCMHRSGTSIQPNSEMSFGDAPGYYDAADPDDAARS